MRFAPLAFFALTACADPAFAHDAAAWTDPARDAWFKSLRTPEKEGRTNISCCDFRDATPLDPDKVHQEKDGSWSVDLGDGFIPVPPDRVVTTPSSIDGLPYIFMMGGYISPDSPNGVRCFVPPVGLY